MFSKCWPLLLESILPDGIPGGNSWEQNPGQRLGSLEYSYNCDPVLRGGLNRELSNGHIGSSLLALSPALWSLWPLILGLCPEKTLVCI